MLARMSWLFGDRDVDDFADEADARDHVDDQLHGYDPEMPALRGASRGVFDVGVLEILLALALLGGGLLFYTAFDQGKEWQPKHPGLWDKLLGR